MSRYTDVDALYETLCHLWDKSDSEDFEKGVFKIIINAPSIDIVRCRECKWFDKDNLEDTYCTWSKGLCNAMPDDFCSYGERREP